VSGVVATSASPAVPDTDVASGSRPHPPSGPSVLVTEPAGPARGSRPRLTALPPVAALALLGGAGFGPVFGGHDLRVVLPVAAILPVVLVAALTARRERPLPAIVTVAVWSAGFVVWAVATVASPAGGIGPRLSLVRSGALHGWARLLDVAVPAPPEADLLLVPAILTWLAAALGAELVVRTRTRLLPALPAVVLLTVATAYAAPTAGSRLAPAGGFAALVVALLVVRRDAPPARGGRLPDLFVGQGRLASAVRACCALIVVVAVGVGLAGGPLGGPGGRAPADPRSLRDPRATALMDLDPLSRLAGWTAHPDQVLFQADLAPAPSGPVPLRLAVLDRYDGADWSTTARYLPAGQATAARPAGPNGRRSAAVDQRLTIVGLGGDLVPAMAGLRRFTIDAPSDRAVPVPVPSTPTSASASASADRTARDSGRFAVAPGDGALARTSPLSPGTRLRMVSTPPAALTAGQLLALTVSRSRDDDRYLALPDGVPGVLRALATLATRGGVSPYQQAALLRQYLMATFTFDPTAPAGHSLAHVDHFLEQTRRGSSEQFATAFVLAARSIGLPARLVVGFVATGAAGRTVRGSDALAWAEIDFEGVGWMPFFPTPRAGDARGASVAGSAQGESAAQTSLVNAVLRATAAVGPAAVGATRPGGAGHDPGAPGPSRSDWPHGVRAASAGTALLLAGYLALAWMLPALRRRRSARAGGPRPRITAAWQRTIELLADAGRPMSAAATPNEVVAGAADLVDESGRTALRGLADLATLALFDDAAADRWAALAGRRAADEAWRQVDALEQALRRAVARRRRWVHQAAPRTVATEIRRLRRLPAPVAHASHRGSAARRPSGPEHAADRPTGSALRPSRARRPIGR